jgi:hypothetical protein
MDWTVGATVAGGGFDALTLTLFTNSNATRRSELERVVGAQPGMRAAGGSERWRQEQTDINQRRFEVR